MNVVITISMVAAGICYTMVGWQGYLTFSDNIN